MAQILDGHIDTFLCSQCHKYLSVLPVKLYDDGSVKCGRCTTSDDGGVVSLYQELAQHCLFKCVNRYQGCRKLLLPSEANEHETICIGKKLYCSSCKPSPKNMNCLKYIEHLKQNHIKNYLNNNTFYVLVTKEAIMEKYFYIQDDIIFVVILQFIPNTKYLYVGAATIWKLQNVTQQFIISSDSLHFKYITDKQKCTTVGKFETSKFQIDVSNIINQFLKFEIILDTSDTVGSYEVQMYLNQKYTQKTPELEKKLQPKQPKVKLIQPTEVQPQDPMIPTTQNYSIELTLKFFKKYPLYNLSDCGTSLCSIVEGKRVDLACSNCKALITTVGMTCVLQGHSVCLECSAWCGICDCPVKGINYQAELFRELLLFPCKWKCGIKCISKDLIYHERRCEKNNRKCPVCSKVFTYKGLQGHLKDAHKCEFVHIYNLTQFLKDQISSATNYYYFILNNKMFKFKWTIFEMLYGLEVIPCDDMTGFELFVIKNSKCEKLFMNEIVVAVAEDPMFFLKHFH